MVVHSASTSKMVDTRAADTNPRRSYRPRRSNADTIKVETCQQLPIEKSPLAGRAFMAVTATTPAVMVRARRPSNSEQYEHDTKTSAIATGKTEGGCANSSRRQNTEKNLFPNKHGSTRHLSSK
jgi:hypothetical protein